MFEYPQRGAWVVKIIRQDATVVEVIRCLSEEQANRIAMQLLEEMPKLNISGIIVVGYEVD